MRESKSQPHASCKVPFPFFSRVSLEARFITVERIDEAVGHVEYSCRARAHSFALVVCMKEVTRLVKDA